MRRVEIEWVDSQRCADGWDRPDAYKADFEQMRNRERSCFSVGYLLDENDEWIALVQSRGYNQVADAIFIPKLAVIRQVNLGVKGE